MKAARLVDGRGGGRRKWRLRIATRYAELARALARDIAQGRLPVGARLPSEVELAAEHDVSRATVRSALSVIEEMGLVSRRPRRGTRVEAAHPARSYTRSVTTLEDLVQYAAETERRVEHIEHVTVNEERATRLGCRPGQRWLNVQMVRSDPGAPDHPICWTDAYLEPRVGEAIREELQQATGLLCEMTERASGRFVVDVEQTIRAALLPETLAPHLHATPGSAALEITRHYIDQAGALAQITVSTHPADRFDYRLALHRMKADPDEPGTPAPPAPHRHAG
jgi:DNA-binding GntR family transcriptional regulator